jgi:hypothetical protein
MLPNPIKPILEPIPLLIHPILKCFALRIEAIAAIYILH